MSVVVVFVGHESVSSGQAPIITDVLGAPPVTSASAIASSMRMTSLRSVRFLEDLIGFVLFIRLLSLGIVNRKWEFASLAPYASML